MSWLLADIGGTHTRCTTWCPEAGQSPVSRFSNHEHVGVREVLDGFLGSLNTPRPTRALLAIAAPVMSDEVQMINIDWSFSQAELANQLQLEELALINDFGAVAHALPGLRESDTQRIGGGRAQPGAVCAVLGPGTGLGVASLVESAGSYHTIIGEGGHVSLAANNAAEARIIASVQERYGHCSAERLVSGSGISLVHELMHEEAGVDAATIGQRALEGDDSALGTLNQVFCFLGTVAADVALTVGAFGGVFIAGGIIPRYLDSFQRSGFRRRFEEKGRYRGYLASIPTAVITAPDPGIRGLVALARSRT